MLKKIPVRYSQDAADHAASAWLPFFVYSGALHVREVQMPQRFCLALLACTLVFAFGTRGTEAGWRDTELTRTYDANSLVISIKKHKHDDDNGGKHKQNKKKGDERSDERAPASDQGSMDAKNKIVAPSSPSDETLRYKPVGKLGVHPSQPSTPSGQQVCPKGYWGTWPNCTEPYQDGSVKSF